MISLKQFCALKHGAVVWWGTRAHGYLRTVLFGPADGARGVGIVGPGRRHIGFAIRRRSWTGRATTAYGFNDVRYQISPTKRRIKTVISGAEAQYLGDRGFDVRAQYARELREKREMNKRMCRACPFEPLPLP